MHHLLRSHLFLQPANILLQDWMVPQGWPHHIIQQTFATTTCTFFLSQPLVPQGWPHHTTQQTHLLLQHVPFSSASHWYHRVGRTPYSRHTCYYNTHLFPQPAIGTTGLVAHHTADTPATTTLTFFLSQPLVPKGWSHTIQQTHLLLHHAPFSSAS